MHTINRNTPLFFNRSKKQSKKVINLKRDVKLVNTIKKNTNLKVTQFNKVTYSMYISMIISYGCMAFFNCCLQMCVKNKKVNIKKSI